MAQQKGQSGKGQSSTEPTQKRKNLLTLLYKAYDVAEKAGKLEEITGKEEKQKQSLYTKGRKIAPFMQLPDESVQGVRDKVAAAKSDLDNNTYSDKVKQAITAFENWKGRQGGKVVDTSSITEF